MSSETCSSRDYHNSFNNGSDYNSWRFLSPTVTRSTLNLTAFPHHPAGSRSIIHKLNPNAKTFFPRINSEFLIHLTSNADIPSFSCASLNPNAITFCTICLNASKSYNFDDTPADISTNVHNISIHTMNYFLATPSTDRDFTWLDPGAKPFYPRTSLCNSMRLNPYAAPFSPCIYLNPNAVPFTVPSSKRN